MRHKAATKLEMEQWPLVLKKRRVEKPSLDDQYSRALCGWIASLEAPPEDFPPDWWCRGMSLFGERSSRRS